jgi:YVTN family beta-propeller protein
LRFRPLLASCCLLALAAVPAAMARDAPAAYVETHAAVLGAPDKWDYVLFDPSRGRVFVAHGDRTDMVDALSGRILGHVALLDGAHGTAVAPDLGRGFADSSKTRSLTVFDLDSFAPVKRLPAGEDADAVVYDAASKRVFVMNGDSGTISVIDAVSLTPVTTMQIGSKLEFAAVDGRGALFVNLAAAGAVTRIDTRRAAITARWPVPDCISPHGMAYDAATRRVFTSCVDGKLKVLDAGDGHIVASLPIGRGSDSVAVDTRRRLVFSANSSGTVSVIAIRDGGHFDEEQPLRTPHGARTMAVDPASGRIFLASATARALVPVRAQGGAPRYSFVPGSLKLLMFDPSNGRPE